MKISQLFFGAIFCGGVFFTFFAVILGGYCLIKTFKDIMEESDD